MENINVLEKEIAKVHGGSYTRLVYKSEMPLKAAYKNLGWSIVKVTETTARLGVNYGHIRTVIERHTVSTPKQVTNNYEWIIPNRIAFNTKTGKKYIHIATTPNANTKVKYIITDQYMNVYTVSELSEAEKFMVIDSYWNPKEASEVRKISLENLLAVNHIGREVFA